MPKQVLKSGFFLSRSHVNRDSGFPSKFGRIPTRLGRLDSLPQFRMVNWSRRSLSVVYVTQVFVNSRMFMFVNTLKKVSAPFTLHIVFFSFNHMQLNFCTQLPILWTHGIKTYTNLKMMTWSHRNRSFIAIANFSSQNRINPLKSVIIWTEYNVFKLAQNCDYEKRQCAEIYESWWWTPDAEKCPEKIGINCL